VVVQTAADGKASTPWTLATPPGGNTLVARGFGIGGSDFNGPRTGGEFDIVDPFHPIQHAFDPAVVDPSPLTTEVLVKTGSLTFTAEGVEPYVATGLLGVSSSGTATNIEANPGNLFTLNTVTGLATLVGASGIPSFAGLAEMSAIAFDNSTGTLYAIAGSSCGGAKLITLDRNNGAGTLVGTLTGSGFDGSSGVSCVGGSDALAIASDGTMYAGGWNGGTSGASLLRVDKSTGAVLAKFSVSDHLAGLAFDAGGTLWGSHGNNAEGAIHSYSLADGTPLSTLPVKTAGGAADLAVISDLALGPNGVMYASLPSEGQLATIDLVTGVLTRIGSFGAAAKRIAGITFGN
jgi:hypothetical protein